MPSRRMAGHRAGMISHSFFLQDTETFFDYYKNNMIYPDAEPNAAHYALARLEEMGKLQAMVTQNIDGLHQRPAAKRSLNFTDRCCATIAWTAALPTALTTSWMRLTARVMFPTVQKCGGIVKPDVVLYEESLDTAMIDGAVEAIRRADVLIVGGTSLVVYPAAGLIRYLRGDHLVLINKGSTPYDKEADLVIHDAIGKVLGTAVKALG